MARKRYKPEEIVGKLRQAEVLRGQGMAMAEAIRQLGISEVTFYRWRNEYGGMSGHQLSRLKQLEKENERLRRKLVEQRDALRKLCAELALVEGHGQSEQVPPRVREGLGALADLLTVEHDATAVERDLEPLTGFQL